MSKKLTIKDGDGDELTLTIAESVIWLDTQSTCLYFLDKSDLVKLANFILENIK